MSFGKPIAKTFLTAVAHCLTEEDVTKELTKLIDTSGFNELAGVLDKNVPYFSLISVAGKKFANAIAPELMGSFIGEMDYQHFKEQFKHPSELNHDLEKLMKDAAVRAMGYIKRLYRDKEKTKSASQDNSLSYAMDILKNMEKELKLWIKEVPMEEAFLESPEQCLVNITNYVFNISNAPHVTKELQKLRQFFTENLSACFQLAFKEALKNNKTKGDGKAFAAFQIWILEDIQKTSRATQGTQQKILDEIAQLKQVLEGEKKIDEVNAVTTKVLEGIADDVAELKQLLEANHTVVVGYLQRIVDNLEKIGERQAALIFPRELTRIPQLYGECIGREEDLRKLEQALQQSAKVVVMNGLGGIGKTTLTKEFVQKHQANYDHLAWITVSGKDIGDQDSLHLIEAVAADALLAKNLHLTFTEKDDAGSRFEQVMSALRNLTGHNLLVIDNAGSDLTQPNLRDALPHPPHWQVLVTSRQKLPYFTPLTLPTLPLDAARAVFRAYCMTDVSDTIVDELLTEVGCHTLTVELLAKTLDTQFGMLSIAELTRKLKAKQLHDEALQSRLRTEHSPAEMAMYQHLMVAFDLAGLNEEEKWLLQQFALLPLVDYEVTTLFQWLQIEPEKKTHWLETLRSLERKGWLQANARLFSMHRLIQQVIQYQMPPSAENVGALIKTFEELLAFDERTNFAEKFPFLLPAEFLLNQLPEEDADILGKLRNNLGIAFMQFGTLGKARALLEQALTSAEQTFGYDHPTVAVRQSNLATVFQDLGDYERARALLEQALASDEQTFGSDHPEVAIRQSNLALVYRDLGNYERARDFLELALASAEQNFGSDHPTVARRQCNLAMVYRDLGNYERARDLMEQALASDEQNFGADHPNVAVNQSNLALVYQDLGNYERARDLMELALAFDEQNFGADHPIVAVNQSNLATVYRDLENYERARDLMEQALASAEQNFGSDHPTVARRQCNLAMVYRDLGNYERARDLMEQALASDEATFGSNHPEVAMNQSNLALVYQNLGNYERARDLLELALASAEKNFGSDHPTVAIRCNNTAHLLLEMGELNVAFNYFQRAYQIALKVWGENHPHTKLLANWLSYVREQLGG